MNNEKLMINNEKCNVGAGSVSAKRNINKINANQNAITLIALTITIIILLILVGVTISLTLGDNGLFSTTQKAGEETKKQAAIELINIKIADVQIQSYAIKQSQATLQDIADKFFEDDEIECIGLTSNTKNKEKLQIGNKKSFFAKLKEYPYEFEINNLLQIISIDGEKIKNNENISDNYEDKTYTQDGLKVYDNRVTIIAGGYFVDDDNVVWVNITLKTNRRFSCQTQWRLIYDLPSVKEYCIVTDVKRTKAFAVRDCEGMFGNVDMLQDYYGKDIEANTEFTIQFKY